MATEALSKSNQSDRISFKHNSNGFNFFFYFGLLTYLIYPKELLGETGLLLEKPWE